MTLVRNLRIAGASVPSPGPVDLVMDSGRISAIGTGLDAGPDRVIDAEGRWLIPGLWDHHVHLGQWGLQRRRLDLSAATSPEQVADLVASSPRGRGLLVGAGYRSPTWHDQPTTAVLDQACGERPVVLISGDCHSGWLSSTAFALLGAPVRPGVVTETEWFTLMTQVVARERACAGPSLLREAQLDAASRGVVGIVDFEFEPGFSLWPERYRESGILKVIASCYPEGLDLAIAEGLRTGTVLATHDGVDRAWMGSLKIISDGSLTTRTALVSQPYHDSADLDSRHGVANYDRPALEELLRKATANGLSAAVHAIGDLAVRNAIDAFASTGATGSIEHAQLVDPADHADLAALGLTASVQPAHLLDDREATHRLWPQCGDWSFPLASLAAAGVRLALGSDAPVAPLDPWLAMAAAVHRGGPNQEPWNPDESLTVSQALAGSVRSRIAVGEPADLVILDQDPFAAGESGPQAAVHLRGLPLWHTFVAGEEVF